jgi:hypothetical protein
MKRWQSHINAPYLVVRVVKEMRLLPIGAWSDHFKSCGAKQSAAVAIQA